MGWANFFLIAGELLLPFLIAMVRSNTKITEISLREIQALRTTWAEAIVEKQALIHELATTVKHNSKAIEHLMLMYYSERQFVEPETKKDKQ
jgi:hypothetical protein